jgi:hypothetical protein
MYFTIFSNFFLNNYLSCHTFDNKHDTSTGLSSRTASLNSSESDSVYFKSNNFFALTTFKMTFRDRITVREIDVPALLCDRRPF